MIYKCMWCKCEIGNLKTDGEEVCEDFLCKDCADKDYRKWQEEVEKAPRFHSSLAYPE